MVVTLMIVTGMIVAVTAALGSQPLRERLALFVGHHREVELDPADTRQRLDRAGHPVGDLVAQRASGDRERDRDPDPFPLEPDPAHHAEIDDRAVELGILDRSERIDDLGLGRHADASVRGAGEFALRT